MVDFSKHLKRNKQMATKETATQQPANNALVIAKKIGIAEAVAKALTPTQIGWLRLENEKRKTFDSLQMKELDVQQKCNNIGESEDLTEVQGLIKQAKAVWGEMKEERLRFTNTINEKLVAPAMEFEKRSEEVIKEATKKELELRTKAAEANKKVNAKQKEIEDFKVHVKNEWHRIAAAYRMDLAELIAEAYENALNSKKQIPPAQIPAYVKKIKDIFRELKLQPMKKFPKKFEHLTTAEATEIYNGILKYDGKEDLKTAMKKLDERFEMYDKDFKNAGKAIAALKKQVEQEKEEIAQEVETESEMNRLVGEAGSSTTIGLGKNEQVKEQMVVVVEGDSEDWALSVIRGFVANWGTAMSYVGVKSFEKLTLGQMAVAIGKMYTAKPVLKFPGLKFEKQVK